jgi:cell wall-associated NlpC family hydrolase
MLDNRFYARYSSGLTTTFYRLSLCSVILTAFILSGCGAAPVRPAKNRTHADIEYKLRQAARQWLRTPHRLGGLDRRGIDCSGLVKVLYIDLFKINLPRTTRLQVRKGRAVASGKWIAGDLVFFKPDNKGSHVGIYLADREFLHASTRRGVMVSKLSEPYWRQCYWKARRVLKHVSN